MVGPEYSQEIEECHSGHIKYRYSHPGSKFNNWTFEKSASHLDSSCLQKRWDSVVPLEQLAKYWTALEQYRKVQTGCVAKPARRQNWAAQGIGSKSWSLAYSAAPLETLHKNSPYLVAGALPTIRNQSYLTLRASHVPATQCDVAIRALIIIQTLCNNLMFSFRCLKLVLVPAMLLAIGLVPWRGRKSSKRPDMSIVLLWKTIDFDL